MVEPAPVAIESRLPALPTRPPTPPRESSSSANNRAEGKGLLDRIWAYGESKTRRASAPVSNYSITPNHLLNPPPVLLLFPRPPFLERGSSLPLQSLLPSAERKPTKSILKAYNGLHEQDYNSLGNGSKLLPPHHHSSFATMLESIMQQLAGKDRDSKIDAYLMLSGSLKASENIPDVKALGVKMSLLLQFIMRDMVEKTDAGKPDTPLAVNAITLLSSFLSKQAIIDTFPSDFPPTLIERAIKTFEDPLMSKEVVKHLMFTIAMQKFGSKVMTANRVERLLIALSCIEIYVKGKSIIIGRIGIYRTLLRQSNSYMAASGAWVENVFTDMLSSNKDIRAAAILFGLECSYSLGADTKTSRFASNFFNIERPEGGKYAEFYCGRLKAMVENKEKKEESVCVPQIWSVMVLFLRGKSNQLEQSPLLGPFLEVIQLCFNTSDRPTKTEANYAWNRLIYSTRPGDKPDKPALLKLRRDPLVAQLTSRKSSNGRKAALGSYCNLLYYTLKPSSTPPQLDLYWDEYVATVFSQCLIPVNIAADQAERDLRDACLILQCLFDSKTQRQWKEERAMENFQYNGVEAKELPALDSKWLRRNSPRVFPVLSPLLEKSFWSLGHNSQITILWQAYITSIGSPAIMEVKVSNDTMACVASIFSFLHRVWNAGPKSLPSLPSSENISSSTFLKSFENTVLIAIRGLGVLPFTERLLCIGTDTFLPVATPSHRPGKLKGIVRSPLHHLLVLMTSVSPGLELDNHFYQILRAVLTPFFEARKSSKARIELAKDLLQCLPSESTSSCRIAWRVLADFATTATDTREDITGSNDQPLGVDYRSVVKILETGISLSPRDPLAGWNVLFEALVASATLDAGDAGRAIVVIEPLAKYLMPENATSAEKSYSESLFYTRLLLIRATFPKDRQALEAARKRLWGTGNSSSKLSSFDPYVQMYKLLNQTLRSMYTSFSKRRLPDFTGVLSAIRMLLGRCPDELVLGILGKVQEGVACWILDPETHLTGGTELTKEVSSLWVILCSAIPRLVDSYNSSKILADLESLVCSGLESKHKSIVNQAIRMWNSTFGLSKEALVYPDRVQDALLRLRPIADLQLPFFPSSLEAEEMSEHRQQVSFAESQEDTTDFLPSTSTASLLKKHRTPLVSSSPLRYGPKTTPQVIIQVASSGSRKRSREETPETGKRKSRKRDSTPRLRHDDSQIQFQAIESSPIPNTVQESQLLTDRQKEVKERQQAEVAMFPDLRTSPRPEKANLQRDNDNEPELPLHQSSSRSRTRSPPPKDHAERQATPNVLPPSEDDNFQVSSPTPTPKRASQIYIDPVAPPSSPPKAIEAQLAAAPEPDDVPSSPPQMPEEPEEQPEEPTTSVEYPSAQVDPYAVDFDRTFSTYHSTPRGQVTASSAGVTPTVEDLAVPKEPIFPSGEDASNLQTAEGMDELELDDMTPVKSTEDDPVVSVSEQPESSDGNGEKIEEQVASRHTSPPISDLQPPSTPVRRVRSRDSRADDEPSSPQYVDALTSPASSDKQTLNEEIFEDAVSSPRKIQTKSASSPLSDIDESSVLRIMKDIDTGSGRAPGTPPHRQTRASSKKTKSPAVQCANPSSPVSMRKAALMNATSFQAGQTSAFGDQPNTASDGAPQSPMPSLIPETPAAKPPAASSKIIAEEQEWDPEDTIVCDVSSLEYFGAAPGVKSKTKRASIGRKRKIEETSEEREVPDSQEGQAPATSPQKTSPRKKQRGRKKKSSQSQSSQASQEAEPAVENDWNQSFGSTDLDSSTQENQLLDRTADGPSTGEAEAHTAKQDTGAVSEDDASRADRELPAAAEKSEISLEDEMQVDENSGVEMPTSPDVGVVNETVIEDAGSVPSSPSRQLEAAHPQEPTNEDAPVMNMASIVSPHEVSKEQPRDDVGREFEIPATLTTPASPTSKPIPTSADGDEDESLVEPSTFQSLKNALGSFMNRLGGASLSKPQLDDLEDMLNDTKEQMYGARRRGREAGL
ncbi:Telomere length regulator protein rif1 [Lachnellula suecica]|uniref:Telomere length regulator protein rif1 n=1 Tax=Lachnellula suecica TaxID=602035 RepID=A0A8T9BZ08_9HELO|nr:Telomere length regulator protein rif1 [Lachnellula suecica]